MKIIKSTFFKKINSEYGNFDLKAAEGFKLRTYIDHESKLLVVEESPEKPPSGKPYLPHQYIVHPTEGRVLEYAEYKNYFNYESQEIISEDGKFKLEYQRKHNTERGRDYKVETLTEIETGKIISTGKGIVFGKEKRKNALERHYDDLARREKEIARVKAQKTLDEHYEMCKNQLEQGDCVLGYYDEKEVFKLLYTNGKYELKKGDFLTRNVRDTKFSDKPTRIFSDLAEFWATFTTTEKWYLQYRSYQLVYDRNKERVMAKFIIEGANKIRRKGDLTAKEYERLNGWENQFYSKSIRRNQYQQYCANCHQLTHFSARYPKHICRKCRQLVTDQAGRKVAFYNTEMMGYGCQGYYKDSKAKEKYDSNICYIGQQQFYAQEARFGGIVIQKKE